MRPTTLHSGFDYLTFQHKHTATILQLSGLCPDYLDQEIVSGSGISWAICKSASRPRQISMLAPHHSVFYRSYALPATQPTVSKHWRQYMHITWAPYTSVSVLLLSVYAVTEIMLLHQLKPQYLFADIILQNFFVYVCRYLHDLDFNLDLNFEYLTTSMLEIRTTVEEAVRACSAFLRV